MKLVEFKTNSHTADTHFIVSEEDYEFVIKQQWRMSAPDVSGNSYVVTANKKGEKLHRLLMNVSDPKIRVDHKNMNTLDNTKQNLRICDASLNAANKKVQANKKSSKFKGVFKRGKKYRAIIGYENKTIRLGTFELEIDAAKAYNKKAMELFGEFAKLNMVEE